MCQKSIRVPPPGRSHRNIKHWNVGIQRLRCGRDNYNIKHLIYFLLILTADWRGQDQLENQHKCGNAARIVKQRWKGGAEHCTKRMYDWFQASARKLMRTALFWVITQQVVEIPYRRFGTTNRSYLQLLEYGTNRFSRNVFVKLPLLAA